MGSRGGKGNDTLEQMGCAPETVYKFTIAGYEKERVLSREFLLHTFDNLNSMYPQEEKDRNRARKAAEGESLSDLAIRVCGLANVLAGMYYASNARREATKGCLNEVLVPARDDFQAAIDAKFRIKFQAIIIAALERQLKEMAAKPDTLHEIFTADRGEV